MSLINAPSILYTWLNPGTHSRTNKSANALSIGQSRRYNDYIYHIFE
jgi:hypothetical protein